MEDCCPNHRIISMINKAVDIAEKERDNPPDGEPSPLMKALVALGSMTEGDPAASFIFAASVALRNPETMRSFLNVLQINTDDLAEDCDHFVKGCEKFNITTLQPVSVR